MGVAYVAAASMMYVIILQFWYVEQFYYLFSKWWCEGSYLCRCPSWNHSAGFCHRSGLLRD